MSDELQKYKCHKVVQAGKIEAIKGPFFSAGTLGTPPEYRIDLEGVDYPMLVDDVYIERSRPEVGGYYVVYEDGHTSYSPAKAFEEGYSPFARPFIHTLERLMEEHGTRNVHLEPGGLVTVYGEPFDPEKHL